MDRAAKYGVLQEILAERIRQDATWREQNHPDGTGATAFTRWDLLAEGARNICKRRAAAGTVTWLEIAREEVFEAFAEDDPEKLRAELIQAAAVFAAWVEAIDRRRRQPAWDAVATRAAAPDDPAWEALP